MTEKKSIGFACGVFDLYHLGHALMFKECKENCNYLVVAVNSASQIDYNINPNKQAPLFSLKERIEVLESCKYIDELITYNNEEELTDLLMSGRFNIRFLGDDYEGKPITAPESSAQIHYVSRDHGWSTSRIKKELKSGPNS
jgi:glycerol-3-phosphate cytidylyltransferase